MAFVNEYIPEEDIEKYGIEEINRRCLKGYYKGGEGEFWCVDRKRDLYLRWISHGREERQDYYKYHFFWHDHLFQVDLIKLSVTVQGSKRHLLWGLEKIGVPSWGVHIKDDESIQNSAAYKCLQEDRKEIVTDLKEALKVHGIMGILLNASYDVEFDF